MQKLSDSIAFIRMMYAHPSKSLLAQWQDQAEKLEGRVASVEQQWARETQDMSRLNARVAELLDLALADARRLKLPRETAVIESWLKRLDDPA